MGRHHQFPIALLAGLAAVAPVFIADDMYDQVVMPRLALTAAATGLALVAAALVWTPIPRPCPGPLVPAAVVGGLYLGVAALATALGVDPWGSLVGEFQRYQGLLPQVLYLVLAGTAAWSVYCSGRLALLAWGIFAGGCLAAAYAFLDLVGLDWIDWESSAPGRAGGMFAQPNSLGLLLAVSSLNGIGLWRIVGGNVRVMVAALTALQLAVLVLTYSRGAWLGFGAGAVVLAAFWLRPTLRQALVGGGVALALLAGLIVFSPPRTVLDSAVDRGATVLDVRSNATRLGLWESGIKMFLDRPVLGAGPDGFSVLFPEYRERDQSGIGTADVRPESSHSILIDSLVSTGVVGTALFVALVAALVRAVLPLARRPSPDGPLAAAVLAAAGAYFAATLVGFSEAMTGWLPWLLLGGLAGEALRTAPPGAGTKAMRPLLRRTMRAVTLTAGLACIAAGAALAAADLEAGRGVREADPDRAISHLERAERLNPLMRRYLLELATVEADAGRFGDSASDWSRLNSDFAPTAHSLLSEAEALAELDVVVHQAEIRGLTSAAADLDPYNEPARVRREKIERNIKSGPNDP